MSAPAAAAAVANSTSREFINDLYELLEQDEDPTNTVILELILEQWTQLGDIRECLRVVVLRWRLAIVESVL